MTNPKVHLGWCELCCKHVIEHVYTNSEKGRLAQECVAPSPHWIQPHPARSAWGSHGTCGGICDTPIVTNQTKCCAFGPARCVEPSPYWIQPQQDKLSQCGYMGEGVQITTSKLEKDVVGATMHKFLSLITLEKDCCLSFSRHEGINQSHQHSKTTVSFVKNFTATKRTCSHSYTV